MEKDRRLSEEELKQATKLALDNLGIPENNHDSVEDYRRILEGARHDLRRDMAKIRRPSGTGLAKAIDFRITW